MDDKQYDALQQIGKNAMESIADMVRALECDYDRLEELRDRRDELDDDDAEELASLESDAGDCTSREDAEQRIQEDPLSLEVRSGWTSIGTPLEAEEFALLLATGGPAVRIVGEIRNGEAYRPRLETQDWSTPWTEYRGADADVLDTYCRVVCCFDA